MLNACCIIDQDKDWTFAAQLLEANVHSSLLILAINAGYEMIRPYHSYVRKGKCLFVLRLVAWEKSRRCNNTC